MAAKSLLTQQIESTPPGNDASWDQVAAAVQVLARALGVSISGTNAQVFADTSAHVGPWTGFTVLSDAVFTTLTGIDGISGVTFKAGQTILQPISTLTLASGTILAYPA